MRHHYRSCEICGEDQEFFLWDAEPPTEPEEYMTLSLSEGSCMCYGNSIPLTDEQQVRVEALEKRVYREYLDCDCEECVKSKNEH